MGCVLLSRLLGSLPLKSSSLTFSPGKSLLTVRPQFSPLVLWEAFSTFPKSNPFYFLSEHPVRLLQVILHSCNFTYVCTNLYYLLYYRL